MAFQDLAGLLPGILLGVCGALLLASRPRQRGALFFGLFTLAWAGEIVVFGTYLLSPDRPGSLLATGLALVCVRTLFLFHTLILVGAQGVRRGGWWSLGAAFATLLIGGSLAILPRLFVSSSGFTPLAAFAITIPSYLVLYWGIYAMTRHVGATASALDRQASAVILVALALLSAQFTGANLLSYLTNREELVASQGFVVATTLLLLFAFGAAFLLGVTVWHLARRRNGKRPELRGLDLILAASILLALVLGSLSAHFFRFTVSAWTPTAIVRLATVALVMYGLVKHEIFGLDLTLKQVVRQATPFAAFAFLAVVAGAVVREVTPTGTFAGMPLFLVAGLAVGGTGAAVAVPLRHRAADAVFPYVTDSEGYRRARGLEVYQAALEQAVAAGREDDPILPILRKRFAISDVDHASLLAAARFAREGDAAGAAVVGSLAIAPPLARYRRDRLLYEGPLAKVWLAKDLQLDRDVVLKEFLLAGDPTPRAEARAASGLASPHVVTVYDVVKEGERDLLVLEYVEGGSLQARLDRDGRLPRDDALRIAVDVCRGLEALHAKGLVHQDVKPANVLLTMDGRAKVSDFGIAERGASAAAPASGGTMAAGPGAGTPHYMAPEQAEGLPVDARTDVYAVGALLYRMLTGRFYLDFGNAGEYRVRRMIVDETPALPLKGEPDDVNDLLARALAKEPEDRPASAETMRLTLEHARRGP